MVRPKKFVTLMPVHGQFLQTSVVDSFKHEKNFFNLGLVKNLGTQAAPAVY